MKKTIIAIVAVIALVAILGVVLMACNADSYKSKLERKGYSVTVSERNDDNVEWSLTASKGALLNGDSVSIAKYKTVDDAKKAEQDLKDLQDNGLVSYEVYRSGKIVMAGTKQGVKDAK